MPGARPQRRAVPCVARRLDSTDRRKRARSFVYLAVSRLQLAADVPPTMRRSADAGKYCHACGAPPPASPPRRARRRFSGFLPLRASHGNANKHFRAPRRGKLGFSLPDWTLSAIFRGARVRNIKKYWFGVFERRTEEIPSQLRVLEILRGCGTDRLERSVRACTRLASPGRLSCPFALKPPAFEA